MESECFVESVASLQKYFYTVARFGFVISQLADYQNTLLGDYAGTGFLIIITSDNFFLSDEKALEERTDLKCQILKSTMGKKYHEPRVKPGFFIGIPVASIAEKFVWQQQ